MVVKYNSQMGEGVDLCDMLLSMNRVPHQSTKYYMHIVFYCIGVVVVNGWLLYRRHLHQKRVPQKKHMPLISFQSAIAASLWQVGKIPEVLIMIIIPILVKAKHQAKLFSYFSSIKWLLLFFILDMLNNNFRPTLACFMIDTLMPC